MRNMYQAIRAKRGSEEEGFTLIELMVVVLIIAILLLIAIPTFLGARERAQDSASKSNLRNALTSAKTLFTDNDSYKDEFVNADTLGAVEPSLQFTSDPSTGPKEISVATEINGNLVGMASKSDSGKCFLIRDNSKGPGTEYKMGDGANCTIAAGDLTEAAAPGGWQDKWSGEYTAAATTT